MAEKYLLPSYFILLPKKEMGLVLLYTLFRSSDESVEDLFMDTSTTYGADLYVDYLATSLV